MDMTNSLVGGTLTTGIDEASNGMTFVTSHEFRGKEKLTSSVGLCHNPRPV